VAWIAFVVVVSTLALALSLVAIVVRNPGR
jgi:hypothetical protein